MPTLTLERAKLNPAFEAYRLAPASNDALIRTSLETPVIPTGPSNHAPLALPQVQARALYNHLAFPHVEGENNCASRALFVDASRQVTEVSLEEVCLSWGDASCLISFYRTIYILILELSMHYPMSSIVRPLRALIPNCHL